MVADDCCDGQNQGLSVALLANSRLSNRFMAYIVDSEQSPVAARTVLADVSELSRLEKHSSERSVDLMRYLTHLGSCYPSVFCTRNLGRALGLRFPFRLPI